MAKVHKAGVGVYRICVPCPCRNHLYDARWTFNGDFDKPTFGSTGGGDSMLIRTEDENGPYVCHSVVSNGMIRYIDDGTTHDLRGQTVPLLEVD